MRSSSSRRFGLSGSWLVKFRPLPPEKFAVRENAQSGQAGCIEPARGNPAEDAAVLETAARVGRAARQAGGVISNEGERIAAAVDAL